MTGPHGTTERVLVTGANGFIGRHLVAALRANGTDVLPVAHRWRGKAELAELLGRGPVDRCVHLGWYADPRDYLTSNVENLRSLASALELVEVLRDRGCRHLVVTGSCAEYPDSRTAISEGLPPAPRSVYGVTKASLHLLLTSSLLGPDAPQLSWARLFNLTGPGEHPERLLPFACRELLAGRSVALTSGVQVRDYLDVRDVADALGHLSATRHRGVVNVCSGEPLTIKELLLMAARLCDAPEELLRFGERARDSQDADVVLGDDAAIVATGWHSRRRVDEAVRDLVAEVRQG